MVYVKAVNELTLVKKTHHQNAGQLFLQLTNLHGVFLYL